MTRRFGIALAVVALVIGGQLLAQNSQALEVKFKAAQSRADIEGDLKAVIKEVQKIVDTKGINRGLAAKALLYIAECYEKLQDPQAQATYERVVSQYGEQTDTISQAKARLEHLRSTRLTARLVCADCAIEDGRFNWISEDGRLKASKSRNGRDLEIRNLVTGQVTQLRAGGPPEDDCLGELYYPRFSPDGKLLTYEFTQCSTLFRPRNELRIIPIVAGGKPKTLVSSPEIQNVLPSAWAADGKSILVSLKRPDETWQLGWVAVADGEFKPIKSLGWRLRPAVTGAPSLSPDGYIAYSALATDPETATGWVAANSGDNPANARDQHIYVIPADGNGPEVELVKGASINQSPVWMPDGKNLLFLSNRGGTFGLWAVNMQGGNVAGIPVPLKSNTGRVNMLGGTRSGAFYYSRTERDVQKVLLTGMTGGDQAADSGKPESLFGVRPAWSPDGKRIAFYRQANSGNYALIVYSLDTRDEVRYVPFPPQELVSDAPPRWFHDGKSVLVVAREPRGDSLSRLDLKTGVFKQVLQNITNTSLNASAPLSLVGNGRNLGSLSSDDKTLYLVAFAEKTAADGSRMDRIMALDVASGQQRLVAAVFEPESLILSPDDRTLYMKSCHELPLRFPLSVGGQPASLGEELIPSCRRIMAVDVGTGAQRTVLTLENSEMRDLSLSSDGRRLVATVGKPMYDLLRYAQTEVKIDDPGALAAMERDFAQSFENRLILVSVAGDGYRELYRFNLFNPQVTPPWTRDGNMILLPVTTQSGDAHIVRIEADSGGSKVVSGAFPPSQSPPGLLGRVPSPSVLTIHPDGKRMAVETTANVEEIWELENVSSFLKAAK